MIFKNKMQFKKKTFIKMSLCNKLHLTKLNTQKRNRETR